MSILDLFVGLLAILTKEELEKQQINEYFPLHTDTRCCFILTEKWNEQNLHLLRQKIQLDTKLKILSGSHIP